MGIAHKDLHIQISCCESNAACYVCHKCRGEMLNTYGGYRVKPGSAYLRDMAHKASVRRVWGSSCKSSASSLSSACLNQNCP